MPTRKWLLLPCVLLGIVALSPRPHAQSPTAAFHALGDLPGGGVASIVRDATKVDGTIYAVGASSKGAQTQESFTDTPILWTWDGAVAQMTGLPEPVIFPSHPTNSIWAYAITPDAAYIASRMRNNINNPNGSQAVRVSRTPLANLFLIRNLAPTAFAAVSLSNDGSILYGERNATPSPNRTVRFVNGIGSDIPLLTGMTGLIPAVHGSSSDGSVMVGTAVNGLLTGTNGRAVRYVHSTGTTSALPLAPGGTWSFPLAVSPDGNQILTAGNSEVVPNGELHLVDAQGGTVTSLGSPNTAWVPQLFGGMTADGSVVAVTYAAGSTPHPEVVPNGDRYAYLHNQHGWFHLANALAAQGIDLLAEGWDPTGMLVTGMSTADGVDLVFGQGWHTIPNPNGPTPPTVTVQEGFVAEFPAGVLASFKLPPPAPPSDTSVVGVWSPDPIGEEDHFIVLTADGAYYQIEDAAGGFERGSYTFDGNLATITTRLDTNGSAGLSDDNGSSISITVNGDTLGDLHRIVGGPGSLVGAWVGGNPTEADDSHILVFTANTYGYAQDFDDDESATGTYTWDPVTHQLDVMPTGGAPDVGNFVTLTPDGLRLFVIDDGGETFSLTRVVDPATISEITNPQLSASGVAGQAFSYGVTATNAVTFGATGLPDGLSINSSTGEISGTPIVGGQFAVTISASNAIGVSDIETLTLTIANQLTVTGAPETAAYGSSFTVGTSGGGGGNVLVVSFEASDACSNTDGGAVITMTAGWGSCMIRATKAGDTNFEPTTSSPAFVVATRAQARVAAAGATKVYGSRDPALTGSVTGFLPADDITVGFFRAHGEAVVGSPYTIHAQISAPDRVGVSVFQNYDISSISAEFTITPFPLVIAAKDITRQYGVPSPALQSFYGSVPEVGGFPFLAVPPTLSTLATLASDVGIYRINIDGAADPNFAISQVPGRLTITPATVKVTLRSSSNPSKKGETVTLTATVVFHPNVFLDVFPEGSVTILGTGVVSPTARLDRGVATSSFKYRTLGSYPLTVQYEPSTTTFNFARSEDANEYGLTQVVGKAPTNDPTLISSTNPAYYGQGLTLTARVTSPYVDPVDGYVTFQDGKKVIGREPLIGGYASLVIPPSATPVLAHLGMHVITAAYDGNTDFEKSIVPATLNQSIGPIFTTTTFTVNPIDIIYNHAVTVTARVSSVPLGAPTPRGTVSFVSGLGPVVDVPLDDTGTATRIVSTLPAGVNVIQAAYRGFFGGPQIGTIFAPSHGTSKDVNVRKASINIKLDLRDSVVKVGQKAVLVATVYFPDSAVPSNHLYVVHFYDGLVEVGSGVLGSEQPLCSCVDATLVLTPAYALVWRPGIHSMTAKVFAGGNYEKEDASKPENASSTPKSLEITVK